MLIFEISDIESALCPIAIVLIKKPLVSKRQDNQLSSPL